MRRRYSITSGSVSTMRVYGIGIFAIRAPAKFLMSCNSNFSRRNGQRVHTLNVESEPESEVRDAGDIRTSSSWCCTGARPVRAALYGRARLRHAEGMDGRYKLPNARPEECRCRSKPGDPGLQHEAGNSRR